MFSEKIKQLRKGRGYTQLHLANLLNVTNGTIAMWEAGKRQPDYEMLKKIATIFDVTIDYLLRDNPELIPIQPKENTIRIIGRGGTVMEATVTDEQRKAFETLLGTIDPDVKI